MSCQRAPVGRHIFHLCERGARIRKPFKFYRAQESIPILPGRYENPIWLTGPPGYKGWAKSIPWKRFPSFLNVCKFGFCLRWHSEYFTVYFSFSQTGGHIMWPYFRLVTAVQCCSLAGRYDNPVLTRFLYPIDCCEIPAQGGRPL